MNTLERIVSDLKGNEKALKDYVQHSMETYEELQRIKTGLKEIATKPIVWEGDSYADLEANECIQTARELLGEE